MSGSKRNSKHPLTQQTLLWDFLDNEVGDQQTRIGNDTPPTIINNISASSSESVQDLTEVLAERYTVLGILGKGGMGEVLRVLDTKFERTLAMKIIHGSLITSPLILQLFIKEAKSTGLLQHPGTVSVHDFGTLPDGRLYFTMQEIQGITLKEAIQTVYSCGHPSDWGRLIEDWSIHRLLGAFERICETLAYAHDMGIMHRDIKPSNFMLGSHGEVLVMDWGIAKILPHGEKHFPDANAIRPNIGSVVGTPDYIAPEQAQGESDDVTARSDVFSLGCVLYEILTGTTVRTNNADSFQETIFEPCPALPTSDDTLQDIYRRCTAIDPLQRYPSAVELHNDLSLWLDGESKRQRALEWVSQAKEHHHSVLSLYQEIEEINRRIQKQKNTLRKWSPLAEKHLLWNLEDERDELHQEADLSEMNSIEWLHSALNHAPDLTLAHQALTRIYHDQHQRALLQQNHRQAHLTLELMRLHDRGEFESYLSGMGHVCINIPFETEWNLFQCRKEHRQDTLVQIDTVSTGGNRIEKEIEIGSYVLQSQQNPNHSIPFQLTRSQHTIEITHQTLPTVQDGECWIPSGPCWVGSITEPDNPYRQIHIDGFFMMEHPITNKEYLAFLHDLVQHQGLTKAMKHVPRTNALSETDAQPLYQWNPDSQTFSIEPDPQGDCWDLDWPVIMVSGNDAIAFAQWFSQKTNTQWRLPSPEEWEKSARGVDGRSLPWGNHFEPTWACVRGHKSGRALPATIHEHPTDCSIYGVFGLAGNVQDFCVDPNDDAHICCKGGAWSHHPEFIYMAVERRFSRNIRLEVAGIRLVRSLSKQNQ